MVLASAYDQKCPLRQLVLKADFTLRLIFLVAIINEPRHEKTCFSHMRTTKVQISLRIRAARSAPLLFAVKFVSISEILSLYLASVAVQAGLSLTWSKTGFLVTRLKQFYESLCKYTRLKLLNF